MESKEYAEWLKKFEVKKTTDDCYTPPEVYDTVKNWAVEKYNLYGRRIVRPFFPGGDYERFEYLPGDVVLDNPPFSILTKIVYWYQEHKIDYFLFAPGLTLFSTARGTCNYIVVDCTITYENGAQVKTGFVTNLGNYKIETAPDLKQMLKSIQNKGKTLSKLEYPKNVITATRLKASEKVQIKNAVFIRELENYKKGIYGAGFLISDKEANKVIEAQQKAQQKQVVEFTEKEKDIIKKLNQSEGG